MYPHYNPHKISYIESYRPLDFFITLDESKVGPTISTLPLSASQEYTDNTISTFIEVVRDMWLLKEGSADLFPINILRERVWVLSGGSGNCFFDRDDEISTWAWQLEMQPRESRLELGDSGIKTC